MALRNDWLNRTTKQFIRNSSPADMDSRFGGIPTSGSTAEWIYDPDLSAVEGFPSIYWKITGDVVFLMTPAERAAVDIAILQAQRDGAVEQLDQMEDILRAVIQMLVDELNAHAAKMAQISSAVDSASNYNAFSTAMQAIVDHPQRTLAQVRTAIRNKLGT